MQPTVGGFKLDTARRLAEMARERGHGATSQYPTAKGVPTPHRSIYFSLADDLTTADEEITATILSQFGVGIISRETGTGEILVVNCPTSTTDVFLFSGVEGACGLAVWHSEPNKYAIVNLECP